MTGSNLPDGCRDSDIPGCSVDDYEYDEWFNGLMSQIVGYCEAHGWRLADFMKLRDYFEGRYLAGDYRKPDDRPDMDKVIEDFGRYVGEL